MDIHGHKKKLHVQLLNFLDVSNLFSHYFKIDLYLVFVSEIYNGLVGTQYFYIFGDLYAPSVNFITPLIADYPGSKEIYRYW